MSSFLHKPVLIDVPGKRPRAQREYTASSPDRHMYTPHIAFGIPPPLPTLADGNADVTDMEYFLISKKESVTLSDTVQYDSHSFIPPCSAAVVEKSMEAGDYSFHSSNQGLPEETRKNPLSSTADKNSSILTAVLSQQSSQVSRISMKDLVHPTGSPVQKRDMHPFHEEACSHSVTKDVVWGGGSNIVALDVIAKEQESGQSPQAAEESLDALEERNRIFDQCILNLEHAALGLSAAQDQSLRERRNSASSFKSSASRSVYSEQGGEELADEMPAIESSWQTLAETILLPDSDSSDEEGDGQGAGNELLGIHSLDVDAGRANPATTMETIPEVQHPIRPSSLLPGNTFLSPARHKKYALAPLRNHSPPKSTVYQIATSTSTKALASLLVGPKIDIVDGSTGDAHVSKVPERMLVHFCGQEALTRLLPGYHAPQEVLEVPASEAEKEGIVRVLRFMRRCCSSRSHASSGNMRIPQGSTYLQDGIETVRACRVLGLTADAERMERLVANNLILSDDTIDQIWNGHFGSMRDTFFGDAVIWLILKETQKDQVGMGEELMCMLEYEEFRELKERVREEVKIRKWRSETRDEYLDRCYQERKRRQRRRLRLQNQEKDRIAKIVNIRAKEMDFGLDKELPTPPSEPYLSAESGDAASTRSSNNVANTNKELPTPPSETESVDSTENSASHMYATYARSLGEDPRSLQGSRSMRRDLTTSTGSHSMLEDGLTNSWENPRAAPIPRKRSGLWMRLKNAFEG